MTPAETRKRPTGRRAGDSGTRDAILDAARDLFAERGYDGASTRAIATRAGVDPALIRHFFVDKGGLFAAILADRSTIPARITGAVPGDPATLGRRVADAYLRIWEAPDTRPIVMALVRSAVTSTRAGEMLAETMGARLRDDARIGTLDDERLRGFALAAAHLFGVAVARHLLKIPPIAELPHETLVAQVAPAIQAYLTPA